MQQALKWIQTFSVAQIILSTWVHLDERWNNNAHWSHLIWKFPKINKIDTNQLKVTESWRKSMFPSITEIFHPICSSVQQCYYPKINRFFMANFSFHHKQFPLTVILKFMKGLLKYLEERKWRNVMYIRGTWRAKVSEGKKSRINYNGS